MRLDKLTVRLQEAMQEAIGLATEFGHQQVEPEHLFYTLLKQRGSLIASVFDLAILITYLSLFFPDCTYSEVFLKLVRYCRLS